MVNYTCTKCNKNFNKKSNYLVHINKKFTCVENNKIIIEAQKIDLEPQNININPQNIKPLEILNLCKVENNLNLCCNYCGAQYNRRDNLKRHIEKYCKVKKIQDEEEEKDKENIFKLLLEKEEQIKKIEKEKEKEKEENNKKINNLENYVKKLTDMNIELNNKVSKLLEKMSVNNITNITNNNTNNNIIISKDKLVNFGEEDVKEIDPKLFNKCFGKFGKYIFEEASKNIWLDKPKNKNFYISDISRKKAMTYKNGEFHTTPLNTVQTIMNQQLYKYFKHSIEEIKKTKNKALIERVEKELMTSYKKFFNAYDNDKDRYQPDSEQLEEFEKVVNSHLSKIFSDAKKDIKNNYNKIKNDVLDNNLLKQIEYEPAVKKRGRPKKNIENVDIKTASIPKSVSGKNEIKNILKELKEEIKDIKDIKDIKNIKDTKKEEIIKEENKKEKKDKKDKNDKKDKEIKKDTSLVINRKGITYYIDDSIEDSDLESLF